MENKEDYIDVPRVMLKSLKRDLKAALGPVPDIPRLSDEQRKEAYNRGVKVFGLTLNECIEQLVNRLSSRQRRGFKWIKKHFVSGFQIPKSGHITFRFGKDGAISINHLIYRLYCNEARMAQLTCKEEIYRLCCKIGCGNPEHLIFIGMKEANRRRICQKSQEDCDHEPKCIRKKRQLIPLPDAHQEVDKADDVAMDLAPEEIGVEEVSELLDVLEVADVDDDDVDMLNLPPAEEIIPSSQPELRRSTRNVVDLYASDEVISSSQPDNETPPAKHRKGRVVGSTSKSTASPGTQERSKASVSASQSVFAKLTKKIQNH